MNSFSRSGSSDSGSVRGIRGLDLAAQRRLVAAETGVDQPGGVGLREQVAVRHRIAGGARRIGRDPAVEPHGILERVELAGGKLLGGAAFDPVEHDATWPIP